MNTEGCNACDKVTALPGSADYLPRRGLSALPYLCMCGRKNRLEKRSPQDEANAWIRKFEQVGINQEEIVEHILQRRWHGVMCVHSLTSLSSKQGKSKNSSK